MRHRRRAHVGAVHVDLQRTLVRQRYAVVPVVHRKFQVLFRSVVQVRRNARVNANRHASIALQVALLRYLANVHLVVRAQPTRSSIRFPHGRLGIKLHCLRGVCQIAYLLRQGLRRGEQIIRVGPGENKKLGVRVDRIRHHGDSRARSRGKTQLSRQLRRIFADQNRVALRDREVDWEAHRPVIRQHAEPGSHNASSL